MTKRMNTIVRECRERFARTVEQRGLFDGAERFLLLFSGGKDCSMMLDLFLHYAEQTNETRQWMILSTQYPRHMYMTPEGEMLENFRRIVTYWQERDVQIEYVTPPFPDFEDDDRDGCKTCKRSRKAVIDEYVNRLPDRTAVLTGFTMYDTLAYVNMLLLTCDFDTGNITKLEEPLKSVTTKMLHKISLREELPNGKLMVRPILPFQETQVHDYLAEMDIPYLTTPCKISKYKYKRLNGLALDVFAQSNATYDGIERFLMKNGIQINGNGLPFEDVENDNYFIDC